MDNKERAIQAENSRFTQVQIGYLTNRVAELAAENADLRDQVAALSTEQEPTA